MQTRCSQFNNCDAQIYIIFYLDELGSYAIENFQPLLLNLPALGLGGGEGGMMKHEAVQGAQ